MIHPSQGAVQDSPKINNEATWTANQCDSDRSRISPAFEVYSLSPE
jgi:hypothetical protein